MPVYWREVRSHKTAGNTTGDAPHGVPVVLVVVVRTWVDVTTVEVQVECVVSIGSMTCRRPVVAVRTAIVDITRVDVPRVHKTLKAKKEQLTLSSVLRRTPILISTFLAYSDESAPRFYQTSWL